MNLARLSDQELAAVGPVVTRVASHIITPVPADAPAPLFDHPKHGAPSDKWRYVDADGRVLGYVCRFDPPGERKQFAPLTLWRDESGGLMWLWKQWPSPRPLINLSGLAKNPSAPVLVVEGEKAARAAVALFPDHAVTTSPGGAEAASKVDWLPLAGRHVVIWPDADKAGAGYANDVLSALKKIDVASVELVNVNGLPDKWDLADAVPEGFELADMLASAEPVYDGSAPSPAPEAYTPSRWPAGFDMRKQGLFREGSDDKPDEWISGPFHVVGEARDPENGAWALALAWRDRDEVQHHALVARADLLGDGVDFLRPLAARGLEAPVAAAKIRALKAALAGVRCKSRVRLVNRTGWHGSTFILPQRTFGASSERAVYCGQASVARYATSGTLDDWCARVAARASGNSRVLLALSVAFAGPVADLLEDEPGGVHLVGASSTGKSTALLVAGSVWGGGGRNGFAQTWRATGNGLEGVAKAHSGTVLPLDELGELDAREAGSVAYALVNGQGKARAGRDGEARVRAEWRCMVLSTGEVRLSDKIEETGRRAKQGQVVRFVDIPADAGAGLGLFNTCHGETPAGFAQTIKADALAVYGTAGPAFVEALAEDADTARKTTIAKINSTVSGWIEPGADGQIMRVARRFAMIGASGEMARAALSLPWADGEAMAAAKTCLDAWLGNRSGDGAGEITMALDALNEAIERHGDARFIALSDDMRTNPNAMIRDALGFRFEVDGARVWGFTNTGWRETLRGVCDPTWAARELAASGALLVTPSQAKTNQFTKKVGGEVRRLFAFKTTAIETEEGL
jgi:putative DNA primase/helicase